MAKGRQVRSMASSRSKEISLLPIFILIPLFLFVHSYISNASSNLKFSFLHCSLLTLKLLKESYVVFIEKTHIADAEFCHNYSFNTHTEGKT